MKQFTILIVLLCICSIAMAETDPNEPQSKDAKVAAAKAAKDEASVVQTYEAIVRRAAADLIDSRITILVSHKKALNVVILKLDKAQSGKSDFVKATIQREIGRIKAKIKSIDAQLKEQHEIKKDLRKWHPEQPTVMEEEEEEKEEATKNTAVNNKLATLSCPDLTPLPIDKFRISRKGFNGKFTSWLDDLPKTGIAVVDDMPHTLTCVKEGYVVLGLGDSDNITTWVKSTFSGMKNTGKAVTVTYENGQVEKYQIWLGKKKPGKWATDKKGHTGHRIFIVANWKDKSDK